MITAKYDAGYDNKGVLHLNQPDRLKLLVPKTGDERNLWLYGAGFILAAAAGIGCIILVRRRRKNEK